MVKTITMTALLFLAGVGAVLWLMPYEWLWIVLPAVTLLLCAVSVALYWYEVRLPIGRMIASMQAMREGAGRHPRRRPPRRRIRPARAGHR